MALQFVYLADHPELVPQVIRWWYGGVERFEYRGQAMLLILRQL